MQHEMYVCEPPMLIEGSNLAVERGLRMITFRNLLTTGLDRATDRVSQSLLSLGKTPPSKMEAYSRLSLNLTSHIPYRSIAAAPRQCILLVCCCLTRSRWQFHQCPYSETWNKCSFGDLMQGHDLAWPIRRTDLSPTSFHDDHILEARALRGSPLYSWIKVLGVLLQSTY